MGDLWMLQMDSLEWEEIMTGGITPPAHPTTVHLLCDEARGMLYLFVTSDVTGFYQLDIASSVWSLIPNDPVNGRTPDTGDGFRPALTTSHIVIIGSSLSSSSYPTWDITTRTWLPVTTRLDSRLDREDLVAAGIGDMAYFTGGSRRTILSKSFFMNVTDVQGKWDELAINGIAAEEFHMTALRGTLGGGNVLAAMGTPEGKGEICATYGVMLLDTTPNDLQPIKEWVTVEQGEVWAPVRSFFTVAAYNGTLLQVGGQNQTTYKPSSSIYAYNPLVCPQHCNGRGVCHMGNCVECGGWTGASCEIPPPAGEDITMIVVGPVVGGAVLSFVLSFVLWKATEKSRGLSSLYNTATVAEKMAAQIACMDLDALEYLSDIREPTHIQRSFITIVKVLKTYRMYLPASVLQTIQGSDSEPEQEAAEESQQMHSSASSGVRDSDASAAAVLQVDLGVKMVRKPVGVCVWKLSGFEAWMFEHAAQSQQVHSLVCTFTDAIYDTLQMHKGTLLSAHLSQGVIVGAWNFALPKAMPSVIACEAALSACSLLPTNYPLKVRAAATGCPCLAGNLGGAHIRVPSLIGTASGVASTLMQMAMTRDLEAVTDLPEVGTWFELRPVDIVMHTSYVSRGGDVGKGVQEYVSLYQVVRKLQGDTMEWMYELQTRERDTSDITKVMGIYRTEGPGEALAFLGRLESSGGGQGDFRLLRQSLGMQASGL